MKKTLTKEELFRLTQENLRVITGDDNVELTMEMLDFSISSLQELGILRVQENDDGSCSYEISSFGKNVCDQLFNTNSSNEVN